MEPSNDQEGPLFTAVSSSARQLFQLLRCISFASKAQVSISEEGLRFTAEESRVMQGLAFLEKTLFTTYIYHPPHRNASSSAAEEEEEGGGDSEISSNFQISLASLIETLQIFSLNDGQARSSSNRSPPYANTLSRTNPASAFQTPALGLSSLCRLSYALPGDPLTITLSEGNVTTNCHLTTYTPEAMHEIPLQRDALTLKIIMRAPLLHDAIVELSATSPTRLTLTASPSAPHFMLSAEGPLGSATVEFGKNPDLLETFQVPRRSVNAYKYALIKGASRAMAIASKVSIRGDEQGVLSLQFLIEVEGGGVSFVDFRFVPLELEDADEENEQEEEGI